MRIHQHEFEPFPEAWRQFAKIKSSQLRSVEKRLEGIKDQICPPASQWYTALELVPPERVQVIILGQDPYHGPGQAMGLAFSVPPRVSRLPPSLKNIFKELSADLNIPEASHGDLTSWAHQGVLLLNSILTVSAGIPGSHRIFGWERITDMIIQALAIDPRPKAFVLWGDYARQKAPLIQADRHLVLMAPHPSPLSAHRGFFGSRPFSQINTWLTSHHRQLIDWNLPNGQTNLF